MKLLYGLLIIVILIGCSSIPRTNQYDANVVKFVIEDNDKIYLLLGYDTNDDDYEDVLFRYITRQFANSDIYESILYLESFAIDKNEDHEFQDDEWENFYKKWWMK